MNPPVASSGRRLKLVVVLAVLSVYCFPYLATSATLKSTQVPYSFAADLSLYLNLSKMGLSNVNPYFGTVSPSSEFGYVTFNTALRVLGLTTKIAGNDLWWAVLTWNVVWWAAIALGAVWFLRVAYPDAPVWIVGLATSLLFFFNFGVIRSLLQAWMHLPSVAQFGSLALPYIRTVFPQVPVALLFPYLTFQVRALEHWKWQDWVMMCFLQTAAFAMFPYATLMMAGITAVAVVANLNVHRFPRQFGIVACYGAICAAFDIAWLLLHLPGNHSQAQGALIGLHPSVLTGVAGGALFMLVFLTIACALAPPVKSRATKWTIVGLGIANTLLMLGDAVFSPALLVSQHGAYFLHTTVCLEIVYLVVLAFERFAPATRWLRTASSVLILFATANGVLLAYNDYRHFLPENGKVNGLASALRPLHVMRDDLVLARAESVDDPCSWVPLFTPAKVLFCRSAQYELSREEKRTIYRERQAFYLYFTGKSSKEVEQAVSESNGLEELGRLVFAGDIYTKDKKLWDQVKASIRTDLIPPLVQVEQGSEQMHKFFSPYKQVLIVDEAKSPVFVRPRLSNYFFVESERQIGDFVVISCRPF